MKPAIATAFSLLLISHSAMAQEFPLTADSLPQPGVPQGVVKGPFRWESQIYPGTVRDFWIYVPQQYSADDAACLLVVQDGIRRTEGWRVATVLDNLIHKGDVPVQIGIFVAPGIVPPVTVGTKPRMNRSFEYDALGGRYAQFLIEEILPQVARDYNISTDPNDAAIAGSSSGGICAMNVAWQRPDRFRRVFSGIGTFAALRGGDVFPTLIRKYENRPIRVFLQDGSNNASAWGGDGYLAGQSVLSALKYAGYDVQHVFGEGGHDDRHGAQVLPDGLRFLWRNYPKPVTIAERPKSMFHIDVLVPDARWQRISQDHDNLRGLTAAADGTVFFCSGLNEIRSIDTAGNESILTTNSGAANGLAMGLNGILHACETEPARIVRYLPDGSRGTVVDDVYATGLVVMENGSGYFTDRVSGEVRHFQTSGQHALAAEVQDAQAMTLSVDRGQLFVSSASSRFTWAYQIQPDGTLKHGQRLGWLQLTDDAEDVGGHSMVVDEGGASWVATAAGVQILDEAGRPVMILDSPDSNASPTSITWGGAGLRQLFVACGRHLYRRTMNVRGSASASPGRQNESPVR